MGQINPQVNSELYGHGTVNSIKYNSISSVPMQSELRHAYWQSGATPSDIRMGYAALGPMTPGWTHSRHPATAELYRQASRSDSAVLGAAAYGTAGTIRYRLALRPDWRCRVRRHGLARIRNRRSNQRRADQQFRALFTLS